jgi:hypothetical protein
VLTIGFVAFGMLADRIAPVLPVAQQAAKYRIFGKNNLVQRETLWAPGAIPNAIEARWSSDTYFADIHKLRINLLDAERANIAPMQLGGIDLQGAYTQTVTQAIAIAREARVASLFTNAANYAASHKITKAGAAEWNAGGSGTVISDLKTMIGTVSDDSLVPAEMLTVIIPTPVMRVVEENSGILDRIKYSQIGITTPEILRAMLGVKEVLVAQSHTAGASVEVAGSDVITGYTTTNLWGDTVWVGLINEGGNQMQPSFARSFNWAAATNGQRRRTRVYRMADEGQEGDWIEVAEAMDEKIVAAFAGGIIINTLA